MKTLLVTMGDALGIGPEIIVKAFERGDMHDCVVVGDVAVLRRAGARMTAVVESPADLAWVPPRCLPVLVPPTLLPNPVSSLTDSLAQLPWGQIHARSGAAAAACIEHAVACVMAGVGAGQAQAIVTAPIHKGSMAAAGVPYPGHTEMLQALAAGFMGKGMGEGAVSNPPPVRMMLANDELRVVLVTIHLALRQAIDAVTFEAVLETLRITHRAAAAWGLDRPRIAVAGLNPHAGEGGLFGDEERLIISPAIRAAQAEGINASGPYAPDTVFMRARHTAAHPGEFDVVVAMTHDHGLIPVKYLGIEHGVNVTLGLPFVRTSPDHGTAFDIAGTGQADPSSLIAALRMARALIGAGSSSG